jgi:hypothetical protein
MIERTRRKLDEARFFYERLLRQQGRLVNDPRAFRYYFSAFIQAARSVTWRLGNEEPEKWKDWEPKWRAKRSTEEQKLLDFTNELRTDEVHRGGTDPSVELEEVAVRDLILSPEFGLERQHPASGMHVFAPPGTPSPIVFRPTYYFEDKHGKEEVTELCKRYLDFLEKMLSDFCADNQPVPPQ